MQKAAWLLSAAIASAACASPMAGKRGSLYLELGQKEGIEIVVNELIDLSTADLRISRIFLRKDIPSLKKGVVEHFCAISGGPCVYKGLSMKVAHKSLGITEADFNAFVENLQLAMNRHGVPLGAQNRLLRRLAPLRPDIIYR